MNKYLKEDIDNFLPTTDYSKKKIKILIRDRGVCGLCKLDILKFKDFNVDHIVPSSKGGSNALSNLQAAHKKCNSIKGSKENLPPEYFIKFVGKKYTERKLRKIESKKQTIKSPNRIKTMVLPYQHLNIDELGVDYCLELYNEIQRHGTSRLSYRKFKDYFEKYSSVKKSIYF